MKTTLLETIVVERELAECFRYVKDFSTIEQWDPGVYRSEKVTPGPVDVGTRFQLLLNIAGKRVSMEYHLTACEENRCLVLVGENQWLQAVDTISFARAGKGKTEITYQAVLTINAVPQLALPVMTPALTRVGKKAVSGLKRALTRTSSIATSSISRRLKDRLILPAAVDFTEKGYLAMPDKGLSEFMDGKTVVITGPTSGLGLAAAKSFARLGARLVLVGRDPQRLQAAKEQVLDFSGVAPRLIDLVEVELSLMAEVRRAANEILARYECIDVLVNNAGVLPLSREVTREGHELALAVNLLAPMLLIEILYPALSNAKGRVINVASGGMYLSGVALGDMQYTRGRYDGTRAYARAKRALVSLTEYLADQWRGSGVDFYSMHPGWAATPGVARSLPGFNRVLASKLRDDRMGADTIVWLGSAQEVAGKSGYFWFDRCIHTTQVIPGTAPSSTKTRALVDWVNTALDTSVEVRAESV